jgi:hypothetical protein
LVLTVPVRRTPVLPRRPASCGCRGTSSLGNPTHACRTGHMRLSNLASGWDLAVTADHRLNTRSSSTGTHVQ